MKGEKRRMWQFPWQYKESLVFVSGIACIGMVLQLLIGPFDFFLLQYPVNLFVAFSILFFLVLFLLARKTSFYLWFSGVSFAVSLIGGLLIFTLIMGLTPQVLHLESSGSDLFTRLGFRQITTSWSFVLLYFVTLLSLGALIGRRLSCFRKEDYAFYLNHIGLWLLLFASGLGAADMRRYVMHVQEGETEWRVYSETGEVLELPIAIQLNDFDMEEYPPKLTIIDRQNGQPQPITKPEYFPIDEKRPAGKLLDWDIRLEEYIHQAVRSSDSTYHEVPMPGSTPAVRVTMTNRITGKVCNGWVCGGNMAQLYMTLALDKEYTLVMTQPEPKRFMSEINVFTQEGGTYHTVLEVNKPFRAGHWSIYQYGYDTNAGKMSSYSSMELVYDPWLYPAYAGIVLLAAGSVCMLWSGNKKRRKSDDME
ncbi:cytochrome c biogenesis protein ResB [Massilibacteroides sp.]|uniref:cytochrome c biogenesis protein ResB n=1 Tax=Massilibacteroides sp. TaxID=2034766 RepID=UPI0026253AAE|nr:cytochrome c biogenesis protein ResB [Massilibacteroides sp.]MDD4516612.1 cytochrome c biogenesis protein ResB [Massilibacteroides sp.]